MTRGLPIRRSDLVGGTRLATDAATAVTDIVEAMHARIAGAALLRPAHREERAGGLTGFVYGTVRASLRLVGTGLEALFGATLPEDPDDTGPGARDALVAAINGVVGDHLARSDNPLATPMSLRRAGRPLPEDPAARAEALGEVEAGAVVLLHGLCMDDRCWARGGRDFAAEIGATCRLTPLTLRYNSGLHVSTNGHELAEKLEDLVAHWPRRLDRLVLIGHSMGGLVARSAVHYGRKAGHRWPDLVSDLVFLGTPHHGAPLERIGNWTEVVLGITPWVAPFTRLGKMRSAGITDLREGSLVDDDWVDGDRFSPKRGRHRHLPLPEGPRCHAIAATLNLEGASLADQTVGDGLVPVESALGRHRDPRRRLDFPADHQRVFRGLGHLELLSNDEVREQVRLWLDR